MLNSFTLTKVSSKVITFGVRSSETNPVSDPMALEFWSISGLRLCSSVPSRPAKSSVSKGSSLVTPWNRDKSPFSQFWAKKSMDQPWSRKPMAQSKLAATWTTCRWASGNTATWTARPRRCSMWRGRSKRRLSSKPCFTTWSPKCPRGLGPSPGLREAPWGPEALRRATWRGIPRSSWSTSGESRARARLSRAHHPGIVPNSNSLGFSSRSNCEERL